MPNLAGTSRGIGGGLGGGGHLHSKAATRMVLTEQGTVDTLLVSI